MPIPEPACAVLPEHTRWRRAELVNELGNFSGSATSWLSCKWDTVGSGSYATLECYRN